MAWESSKNAGFSTEEPWLPLHLDWRARNVALQANDRSSMLSLYRRLLSLRREHSALAIGHIQELWGDEDTLHYVRIRESERLVVALNLSGVETDTYPVIHGTRMVPLLSTLGDADFEELGASDFIPLRPHEGLILKVEG